MNIRNLSMAASLLAITSAIGLSHAQEVDEAAAEEEELIQGVIVVRGFRGSLRDALDEKRQASEIIEALSAEDIGQLPDTSVAESLARLPGVTATRGVAGASSISVRGLGSVLSNGTFNGRDFASPYGDRSVAFSLFPAELISGAGVYKAPAASRIEGGIAGTIDLRTVRPLERDERTLVANFRARNNDLGGDLPGGREYGYRGSFSYIDQFASDTFGVSLGYAGQLNPFASAQSSIYDSRRVGFGGFIDGLPDVTSPDNPDNDLIIPFGADQDVNGGESERHTLLATAQWIASENLQFNFDALQTTFEQNNTSVGIQVEGFGSFGNTFSNVTVDGLNLLSGTATCNLAFVGGVNSCTDRGFGQPLFAQNAIDFEDSSISSYGLEGVWNSGALILKGDVSYSKAEQLLQYTRIDHRPYTRALDAFEIDLPVSSFGENRNSAAFLISPLDFSDPATNRIDGAVAFADDTQTDEISTYKLDAEYDLYASSFFSGLKAGVRIINRRNVLDNRGSRSGITLNPDSSIAITEDVVLGTFNHNGANSAFDGNTLLVLDTQAILNTSFPTLDAPDDPIGSHVIDEDVVSYYAQADIRADLFDLPVDGNIGVRIVDTKVETQGTRGDEDITTYVFTYMPIETSDEYTEILPSLNLNFNFQDDFIVRFAVSRAMARPPINFLSPSISTFGPQIFGGSAGGGNPFLRPFVADQLDIAFEKYINEDTALTLALYQKEIDTFITQSRIETGPPENSVSFIPANGSGGSIKGFEILYQQVFPNLLPDELGDVGVYANYSYNDSDVMLTETFVEGEFGLDGLSEHVGNVTFHYDNRGFGARISYRYRSDFTRPQRPARAFITNRAEGDLSFQISYEPNDKVWIGLNGWNLTDEPRDSYYGNKALQGQYRVFGRNFELAVTYRF